MAFGQNLKNSAIPIDWNHFPKLCYIFQLFLNFKQIFEPCNNANSYL